MKLTNPDYHLPKLLALEPLKEFGSGANKPILMRCADKQSGERVEVVVKLKDGERMGDGRAHACELMGAWLAREMNILVPEPNVVEISADLHESLQGSSFYRRVQQSIGLNFGSQNLLNMTQPDQRDELKRSHVIDAQLIFLFDLMTINPDRTPAKVNMLSDHKRIFAIDHEMAFTNIPFMKILSPRPNPWELNKGDVDTVKNGILKSLIQGKKFEPEPFIKDITTISEEFWEKAVPCLPDEWEWEYWPEVSEFVMEIVEHAEDFVTNAMRTLQ